MTRVEEPLLGSSSRAAPDHGSDEIRDYNGARNKLGSQTTASGASVSRAQALASGSTIERAAALVDLAEDGIGLPLDLIHSADFGERTRLYFLYNTFDPLWTLNIILLLVLNFIEVPSWCSNAWPHPCGGDNTDAYHLGDVPYLHPKVFNIVELVSLALLIAQVLLPLTFEGPEHFWKDRLNRTFVFLSALLAADVILYSIGLWAGFWSLPAVLSFRLAPYLRVVTVCCSESEIRKGLRILFGIIPGFLDMMTLVGIWLLFSAWLMYLLFEDSLQGELTFTSYRATLNEAIIAMFTGSNVPDFWMPAFNQNRIACLVFMAFLFISTNFFMSLILAVVYNGYKDQLTSEYKQSYMQRHSILSAAFGLLDEENKGHLDIGQVSSLLQALNKYRNMPDISKKEMEHIFLALDDSGDNLISEDEFSDLCVAIRLRFVKTDEPTLLEKYLPRVAASRSYAGFKALVQSARFGQLVQGVLLVQAVIIAIESAFDVQDNTKLQAVWLNIEMAFGWLFLVELAAKLLAHGTANYWRKGSNRFDMLVTLGVVATQLLILSDVLPAESIRYALILCVLRLGRVLTSVERYSVIMSAFFSLWQVVFPVIGVTYCFSSIFCSIGIELFGGKVFDGSPSIRGTSYEHSSYMAMNFNDFASGMVLIFQWLNGTLYSDWQSIASNIYPSPWIRAYFVAFLVLGTIFIMNVFIGFVFDAYYTQQEIMANKGGNERSALRLEGVHGANVEVELSDRFQQVMDRMLGGEELKKLTSQKGMAQEGT
ncbi:hypothetical protein KFL_000970180 [Klebsormidium nitens]|uniref:EF-hand domain-containing protein n=1 Tax=Klebsormidium nitens TaxID=105231 RepID=A0A0U9HR89_KLENI|nr:hypothetical protein KFL_000970180 [Klebsormidium nitens]|eukprot:GAQ81992.1 hypothetical protein KFL_000970180 [Klebsormidium nitens]